MKTSSPRPSLAGVSSPASLLPAPQTPPKEPVIPRFPAFSRLFLRPVIQASRPRHCGISRDNLPCLLPPMRHNLCASSSSHLCPCHFVIPSNLPEIAPIPLKCARNSTYSTKFHFQFSLQFRPAFQRRLFHRQTSQSTLPYPDPLPSRLSAQDALAPPIA